MICKICGKSEDTSRSYDGPEMEKYQMCFECNFWRKRLEDDSKFPAHKAVMIDGTHYIIGPEDSRDHFRGFDGAKFQIEFNDGFRVITTNLWCQGEPKGYWKDKFPNNARFENNLKWKKIGSCYCLVEEPKEESHLPF